LPARGRAQLNTGELQGLVTTQAGEVRLPGAEVTVKDASNQQVAQLLSAEDGRFRVPDLPPGKYRVVASLAGFDEGRADAEVTAGRTTTLSLDLAITSISQTVDVVASNVWRSGRALSKSDRWRTGADQFAPSGAAGVLRLLASSSSARWRQHQRRTPSQARVCSWARARSRSRQV
jgi:hypothetical protein